MNNGLDYECRSCYYNILNDVKPYIIPNTKNKVGTMYAFFDRDSYEKHCKIATHKWMMQKIPPF
jgi:hypothetical protein